MDWEAWSTSPPLLLWNHRQLSNDLLHFGADFRDDHRSISGDSSTKSVPTHMESVPSMGIARNDLDLRGSRKILG